MRVVYLLPVLLLLADSCVEKLEVPVVYTSGLVVDGLLTDEPGPHTVKLLITSPADKDLDYMQYEGGAEIRIVDESGNVEPLVETEEGIYVTSNDFKGEVGKKYQLSITTRNDRSYQTDFIEMLPAGEIINLSFDYKPNSINSQDLTLPQNAVDIYLDGSGVAGYSNLLRWRWHGTYQTKTYPEKRIKKTEEGIVPDPLPCSGFVYDPIAGEIVQKRDCECCDCWATEYSTVANSSKDINPGDISYSRIFLARLPIDQWRFYTKYYFEAEQLSVSDEVHRFWQLVEAQQASAGDLFQPNVVQVTGNVRSLNDSDEEVFGVFSVSAVSRKSFFINREDIPGRLLKPDTVIADCRAYFKNSVNQKPPFW